MNSTRSIVDLAANVCLAIGVFSGPLIMCTLFSFAGNSPTHPRAFSSRSCITIHGFFYEADTFFKCPHMLLAHVFVKSSLFVLYMTSEMCFLTIVFCCTEAFQISLDGLMCFLLFDAQALT
jgi:hypothetical protein